MLLKNSWKPVGDMQETLQTGSRPRSCQRVVASPENGDLAMEPECRMLSYTHTTNHHHDSQTDPGTFSRESHVQIKHDPDTIIMNNLLFVGTSLSVNILI